MSLNMISNGRNTISLSLLKISVVLLICKVTVNILSNYPDYFPPRFEADFLLDRESYFWSSYSLAFYSHIIATPCVLMSGIVLMSNRFRSRFPKLHRIIGRCHASIVLTLVVPSGLWMSVYAYTGSIAGAGFAALALTTGFCTLMGWRHAVKRQINHHRKWMTRSYLLLCSAILLRLFSGAATLLQFDSAWTYPLAAWITWLVPLFGFELIEYRRGIIRGD